jgi:hypothetical protein
MSLCCSADFFFRRLADVRAWMSWAFQRPSASSRNRKRRKKEAADLRAYLFLIPLIACLCSIILSAESLAFESALIALGMDY